MFKAVSSNWSRFLVISSSDEGTLEKLSHFAIQKGLVIKLKNGSLLVECLTEMLQMSG